ncbi:phosphohistidine phosphatase [Flavobacterium micromati]|jgi:phosphohistidine phosphatase|uniref:Phosphohistidine phosphatase n=1 Tax=Flavobacterium micromati TaxID=229205 RepID=A0A1M5HLE8_9FLAO|nr:phosphoglycerate mutase family protein [Flavobacterium micromati]MCL6460688.1 histidine phosphatase family protein [Flavobacterium micromati]SHG16747.1 phosphohistidine phosphatase [Flavobacterium micromati]
MKNLILIRHAKSSWEVPMQDKDRGLTSQGVNDAHNVSTHIKTLIPKTFIMMSSPAKRTIDTALIFAQNLAYPVESIIYNNDLYTFDEKKLEKLIKSLSNMFETVFLFCHNGAVTNFVNTFGDKKIENLPTAGFVNITFDTDDWNKINDGKIIKMVFPKNLR